MEHHVEENAKGPYIDKIALVFAVTGHFGSQVSWCPTLFLDDFISVHQSAYPEVANFDSAFSIEKDIVELDVSVENRSAMTVCYSLGNFLENVLCFVFRKMLTLFDQVVEVATSSIFHDHHDVLLVFKHFVKFYYVGMPNLFENINFLKDFFPRVLIFELTQFNHFYCNELSRQFVYSQIDLSESAISNIFDKFVKV